MAATTEEDTMASNNEEDIAATTEEDTAAATTCLDMDKITQFVQRATGRGPGAKIHSANPTTRAA